MKRLIILASLVLLTLQSSSQSFTKTLSTDSSRVGFVTKAQIKSDSLVMIPKTYAIWMAQDIERSRSYSEEILLLNNRLSLKEDIIVKQDTIIDAYKSKLKAYMKLYDSCSEANGAYEVQIAGFQKEVRRQSKRKKLWKYTAIIAPILVGSVVHLDWKYGR